MPRPAGFKHSEETKAKIGAANSGKRGRKLSEETKVKMSESQRKRYEDPEERRKQSIRLKKYCEEYPPGLRSATVRAKISIANKRYHENHSVSEETRRKISERVGKYYEEHPELREIHSESMKKHCSDPEVRKQMSDRLKKWIVEHPEEHQAGYKKSRMGLRFSNTKIERKVAAELDNSGISYLHNECLPEINKLLGRAHMFDFILPDSKIVIECDGDYWHCNPEIFSDDSYWDNDSRIDPGKTRKRDQELNIVVGKTEWTMLRFWEHEINGDVNQVCSSITQAVSV